MPPRKRTPDENQQTTPADTGDAPVPTPADLAHTADNARHGDDPDDGPDTGTPDEPTRSDLQEADEPCPKCMPNGWPANAFSVGCTHGTWIRKRD